MAFLHLCAKGCRHVDVREAESSSEHRDGCGGSVPVCGGERKESGVGEAGEGDDLVLVERRWHVEVDE